MSLNFKTKTFSTVCAMLFLVFLCSCSTWRKLDKTERGALIGTGTGAAIGSFGGSGGALLGGAAGGVAGGLIGNELDEDDE